MRPFDLVEPATLGEAVTLLRENEAARPIAGGTALLLMMKAGLFQPEALVSLRQLPPVPRQATGQTLEERLHPKGHARPQLRRRRSGRDAVRRGGEVRLATVLAGLIDRRQTVSRLAFGGRAQHRSARVRPNTR